MGSLQQFGLSLIQAFQSRSPTLDGVMRFFSFLGRLEFYLLFIPFLFWAVDSRLGMRTLLVLIAAGIAGTFFKLLFHQPRPYWIGAVKPLAVFPASHYEEGIVAKLAVAFGRQRELAVVVVRPANLPEQGLGIGAEDRGQGGRQREQHKRRPGSGSSVQPA